MALNAEILKKEETLTGLTDEQIQTISTLSTNDEQNVINTRVGEIHGQYDRDIEEVLGLQKPQGIKTYEWLKKDILPKAKGDEELQQKLSIADKKVLELEESIKSGKGTEALTRKLEEQELLASGLRDQLTEKETEWQNKLNTTTQELANKVVKGEFRKALIGKKFKDVSLMPEEVRDMVLQNAESSIIESYKHEWVKNSQGKETLVFLDTEGKVLRNPNNKLNPYTAQELFLEKVTPVLDTGSQQPGTGTQGSGTGQQQPSIDFANVKTQLEADEYITDTLLKKGELRGSDSFQKQYDKLKEQIKFHELPFR